MRFKAIKSVHRVLEVLGREWAEGLSEGQLVQGILWRPSLIIKHGLLRIQGVCV